MKIAVDVRSLMEGRLSGVEQYTVQLLTAMNRQREKDQLVLFYNSWRRVAMPSFDASVVWQHFHYPNKLFNALQYLTGEPLWDRLVAADVFFVPNMRLMPLRTSTSLVVTAHDLSFERFPEFYSFRRRVWHHAVRPRHLMQQADYVIAVSESTKADLMELYGIPEDRIIVVYSGVTTGDTRRELLRGITDRYGKCDFLDRPFILYLGTLEPRKNVISLVQAFSAAAHSIDGDLVIAGSPGWLTNELHRAIRESSVRHRIHLVGFVPESIKYALLAAASVFVYPSFYEGFGFPPLEALVSGTPVITSHNSALPEVVGEWALLCNPYSPDELAQVLVACMQETRLVPLSIRHEIMKRYSWDTTASRVLSILRSFV